MVSEAGDRATENDDGDDWLLLASLMHSEDAGSEGRILEQVAAVGRALSLYPADLAQLRRALVQAIEYVRNRQAASAPSIRLYVRRPGAPPGGVPGGVPSPALSAGGGGRGWGFFLVQKNSDEGGPGGQQDVIELFLYQE